NWMSVRLSWLFEKLMFSMFAVNREMVSATRASDPAEFTTHLWVSMRNQPGSLARVADTISRLTANIENISFSNSHDSLTDIQFTLTVRDRKHMARLIRQIRNLQVVERVRREPLS
ncbi:MAG: ACT domain-containing protein, partial [Pseudomonadota bacterium]